MCKLQLLWHALCVATSLTLMSCSGNDSAYRIWVTMLDLQSSLLASAGHFFNSHLHTIDILLMLPMQSVLNQPSSRHAVLSHSCCYIQDVSIKLPVIINFP